MALIVNGERGRRPATARRMQNSAACRLFGGPGPRGPKWRSDCRAIAATSCHACCYGLAKNRNSVVVLGRRLPRSASPDMEPAPQVQEYQGPGAGKVRRERVGVGEGIRTPDLQSHSLAL